MYRAALTTFLFVTFAVSCSAPDKNRIKPTQLPAPIEAWAQDKDPQSVEYRIREMYRSNPSEEMEWWSTYQQGKIWAETDPEKSCANFKKIMNVAAFPLHKLALLHAIEICSLNEKELPALEQVLSETSEPWLQELARTTVLSRATRTGKKLLEMRLNGEMANFAELQTQKITFLQKAIALARQLNKDSEALKLQARLEKVAPRFIENPKPEQYLLVANDLRQARKFSEARALYKKAIKASTINDLDKMRAHDGIRVAYKNERMVDEYIQANREMAAFAKKLIRQSGWFDRYFDATLMLARAIWTEASQAEAKIVLDRLEKESTGKKSVDEILWIRARMEEENGRFSEAVAILEKIPENNSTKELSEKIGWYKAWNLRKIDRHSDAVDALLKMNTELGSATARSRNRFWAAKSMIALGRRDDAKKEFEELIYSDPLSYYALLSYRELDRKLPAEEPAPSDSTDRKSWPGEVDSPFSAQADHDYIEWLISLGENQVAQEFLDVYVKDHPQKAPSTPSGRELLKYYARAGNFKALFARINTFPSDVRDKIIDEEPSLLFPQPYSKFVPGSGKRFGVFPELIYSIMRQESSFDPLARSPADAFGLLQLIPEAAKRTEGLTGIKIKNPEELYKPQINIPVGSAFIRILMDQFDDQFILTVASYNASEKAILNWIKTRYRGDTLEFIEDIPYDETRNYVKLVMRNYIYYLRINSEGVDIAFPEWCLESLQPPIL